MLKIKNKIPSALIIGDKIVERVLIKNEVVWEKRSDYLYIQNTYTGNNTISIQQTLLGEPDSSLYTKTLQYSKDKKTWTTITLSSTPYTITLNEGEQVYFRGNEGVFNYWLSGGTKKAITNITGTESHIVGGNINSLIDYSKTLPQGAFNGIFENDSKLLDASNLILPPSSDGSLPLFAYLYMFKNCSSLTTPPPIIPAKIMGRDACNGMFANTAITSTPILPATTLANYCYRSMFEGCRSLTSAPKLPATTLSHSCYRAMFYNCTLLTSAPELPAKTLVEYCYQGMFRNCTSLNNLTVYADDISATDCTTNWLQNVAPEGVLFNYGSATYSINSPSGIPEGWSEDKADYFYVKNEVNDTNNVIFRAVRRPRENTIQEIEYSKDKINWTKETITANIVITIPINQGEKVYFRNDNGYFSNNSTDTNAFKILIRATNIYSIGGDITTLYNYSYNPNVTMPEGCFRYLFGMDLNSYNDGNEYEANPYLIDASELKLPSICLPTVNNKKTLPTYCYAGMFMLTTGLINPPKNIECQAVGELSCHRMFKGSNITVTPELPATNIGVNGYAEMFMECNYLNVTPELPATNIGDYGYYYMFNDSNNISGSVTLPAMNLAENCYSGMFQKTNITQVSILAKVLKRSCMTIMFADCSSLSDVTVYATDTSNYVLETIINSWLRNVASEGVIHNLGTLTFSKNSTSGIPEGWMEVKY